MEQSLINIFSEISWNTANCYYENFSLNGKLGRETPSEIVLISRLHPALQKLNEEIYNAGMMNGYHKMQTPLCFSRTAQDLFSHVVNESVKI
ncbi:MAG: hypothetical protein QME52_04960 [Bacteroidota bacterium]|nr:hypothetical protein [Bacteroidota bacterium]